jgi:predicted SAM-dependent methyltransferase
VLVSGGKLGILVPDTREVMRRYIHDEPAPMEFPSGHHRDLRDLDECCAAILFSTVQRSHHQWAYDKSTLSRALSRAGFTRIGEFDRYHDPRVAVGAWYQVGIEGVKQ